MAKTSNNIQVNPMNTPPLGAIQVRHTANNAS